MRPFPTPPDIGTTVIAIVLVLAAVGKLYWYRKTRNAQNISEAIARICLALFYFLITYASNSEFGEIFNPDLWRLYSRYAILGIFLVEVIPWFVNLFRVKKNK